MKKKDINLKPRKGGLLGFASGVAALVAMKTQSEDFPIFMIWNGVNYEVGAWALIRLRNKNRFRLSHATFALLSPMMCMLVVPVMCHTVISRAADGK